MKKVIILIDGQNLYYGLKNMGFIERDIRWDLFFNSLIEHEDELIRAYWFRPQRLLDTYYTYSNIRKSICSRKYKSHYYNFKNNNHDSIPEHIRSDIENDSVNVEKWLKEHKTKFSELEYNYDELTLKYQNIEMVKSGVVKVDPFKELYLGEKGVDISLAVKMISLSVNNKCDKIILVSGDYDYAEAIKFVKDNMTKIHIVKIHKGVPPHNKSVSRDLAILADNVLNVYESDIRSKFLVNP